VTKIKAVKPLGFPWETQDPFLFCAHHLDHYPKGNANLGPDEHLLAGRNIGQDFETKDGWRMYHGQTVPGFPNHPHRGFETITIVTQGLVDHADSLGGSGRFGNGDVQWMTAGKGIQHSEMFPLLDQENNNPFELFQIWLNLPKASKFVDAHYSMIWSEDLPILDVEDQHGKRIYARVVAGQLAGLAPPEPTPNSWAATKENDVAVWIIRLEEGAQWKLPSGAEGSTRNLYFYSGDKLIVDGQEVTNYSSIEVEANQELALEAKNAEANILVLQGKPINEPVAKYGPFVMNTQREIMDTMEDYQKTQFGGWPWPRPDQVHLTAKGRFAQYADGSKEEK